jgi:hypothetical protein
MKLLDAMTFLDDLSEKHSIELYHGNLTDLPYNECVDVLVISAFPNDYTPTPRSLIGSLDKNGISVKALARDKLEDKRASSYCWISRPLEMEIPERRFRQIMCYEPPYAVHPAEAVGNVFRCLASYSTSDTSIATVAMPLLSTGVAAVPIADMIEPLVDAAKHWMKNGLPIKRLMLVEHSETKAYEMKGAFSLLKKWYEKDASGHDTTTDYDIFISYCQKNSTEADLVHHELLQQKSHLKIFMDRMELEPGMAWQQKIFNSLVRCRKIMTLYSPAYLSSNACQEEFNIAQLLHLKKKDVLFPVYLFNADPLPQYMTFWHYMDCREADVMKLKEACEKLVTGF